MAPKAPEKQHSQTQQPQQHQQQPHHTPMLNHTIVKHSSPFYISAHTLCHNRRLKLKRFKNKEYLLKFMLNHHHRPITSTSKLLKTEAARRQKLSLLHPDITIDLLSGDEDEDKCRYRQMHNVSEQSVIVYPERMCLERAAILGLMPVERSSEPPPLVPLYNNIKIQQIPIPPQITIQPLIQHHAQQQPPTIPPSQPPRKRKSRPQKRQRQTLPLATPQQHPPILLNNVSIVLSDDEEPEISITYPTSHQIPCLPPTPQNTMQVDEEVTISLVPRSLTATTCASRSAATSSSSTINTAAIQNAQTFPMLPDETTVHTVIANRIYELSLTKLREGLASCGIPEFADGNQKISPQRRKGTVHKPPVVSPPQAPISLKLSSDLSISLISDDEDEESRRQRLINHEALLSPAFLQKLPVNVSIAPVLPIMRQPQLQNHTTELRKLKLG